MFGNIIKVIFIVLFLSGSTFLYASEGHKDKKEDTHHTEKFDPGSFIIEHIGDSYEWHITTIGETHITVPLLILVYSNNSGFNVFFSNRFHHGHSSYKNFSIAQEGTDKGRIIETLEDGTIQKPIDISITKNVAAIFVSIIILLWIFISIANKYKKNVNKAPSGFQNLFEPIILFVRDDIAKPAIGEKKYEKFLPFLLSVFFFIWINNMLGLIPIFPFGANITGNIAVTFVLAFFTFIIITINGNKVYWKHIFNTPGVPWWLKIPLPLMPFIELLGMLTKPFVLMVRLFANISAGHIITMGFFSLIFVFGNISVYSGYGISVLSVAFTIFMTFLELLVAFIQAYVFTLLSALYFGMAVEEHH
ncbi:MAG: F0F1 ATP synthase subunit A [Bacteroidales bacterium]|nr:F0F1 ATP synthase subunit A [Bacteroidales bacterium]